MGIEYKIETERSPDRDRLDGLLRGLPTFWRFDSSFAMYEFRDPDNPGKMPNLAVRVEKGGLYVCDYGGERVASAVIGTVVIHATAEGRDVFALVNILR